MFFLFAPVNRNFESVHPVPPTLLRENDLSSLLGRHSQIPHKSPRFASRSHPFVSTSGRSQQPPVSDSPIATSGNSSSRRFVSDFHAKLWDVVVKRAFIEERVLHLKNFGPTGIIELLKETNLLASFSSLGPFVKHILLTFMLI